MSSQLPSGPRGRFFSSSNLRGLGIAAGTTAIIVALGMPTWGSGSSVAAGGAPTAGPSAASEEPEPGDETPTADPSETAAASPSASASGSASATSKPTPKPSASYSKDSSGKTTITTSSPSPTGSTDPYANLAMGPGVTKTAITVGVAYNINASAYGRLGVEVSNVDNKAQAQAIIDWINKSGGIAGRQVVPYWHALDLALALNGSDEGSKACTAFTQDATVFSVVSAGALNNQCLADAKIPLIASDLGTASGMYRTYANYLFSPSGVATDKRMQIYIRGLARSGFFDRKAPGQVGPAKIGIITFGQLKNDLEPEVTSLLGEFGLSVEKWGQAANDATNTQQLVLQMKEAGVTHILSPEYSPILFQKTSESQDYHPIYGLSSAMSPAVVAANAAGSQLAGSMVVSWLPHADVPASEDNTDFSNTMKVCRGIMSKAGLPTQRKDMASAYGYCDAFFALKVSLDNAPALTPKGLRAGYEGIGTWDSPVTFKAKLGPGKHDGATAYRVAEYGAGCKCYQYTSALKFF